MNTNHITLGRFVVAAVLCTTYAVISPPNLDNLSVKDLGLVTLKSVLDAIGITLISQAYTLAAPSVGNVVVQVRTFAVELLCLLLLQEPQQWRYAVNSVATIRFWATVYRTGFLSATESAGGPSWLWFGVWSLAAGVFVHERTGAVDLSVLILAHTICGCIVGSIWLYMTRQPLAPFPRSALVLTLSLAVWDITSQLYLVPALKKGEGLPLVRLNSLQYTWFGQLFLDSILFRSIVIIGSHLIITIGIWPITSHKAREVRDAFDETTNRTTDEKYASMVQDAA